MYLHSTLITFEESESTVLQLHADTLQAVHHHWDIEQGQDHWLEEGQGRGGKERCVRGVYVCVCPSVCMFGGIIYPDLSKCFRERVGWSGNQLK